MPTLDEHLPKAKPGRPQPHAVLILAADAEESGAETQGRIRRTVEAARKEHGLRVISWRWFTPGTTTDR